MMRAGGMARCAVGVVCAGWLALAPGQLHAQAPQVWVSGRGDDVNSCARNAPCKTFAGAFNRVLTSGVVTCIDPGGYGAVTITRSITIDCHNTFGVLNGLVAIKIDFDRFSDASKTVRIRNLTIEGANNGTIAIQIVGAQSNGSAVFIEDCMIGGQFASPGSGIVDARTGGGALYVANTRVRNVGANGILIAPATASAQIQATLSNVTVEKAGTALEVGAGVAAMVDGSVFAGSGTGVLASGAHLNLNGSVVSGNATGIVAENSALVRVSNSDVAFNGTGISGAVASYTSSRFSGNGAGGVIVTLGAPTSATGQQ